MTIVRIAKLVLIIIPVISVKIFQIFIFWKMSQLLSIWLESSEEVPPYFFYLCCDSCDVVQHSPACLVCQLCPRVDDDEAFPGCLYLYLFSVTNYHNLRLTQH